MEAKLSHEAFVLFLSWLISLALCVRNLQREEPHFVQIQEHPFVDENSELDPEPFVPHKVQKPMLPLVPNVGGCKCGEHEYNASTSIENLECGERPKQASDWNRNELKPSSFVSNGNLTDKSQFPWVVALIERRANGSAIHFCGGTLISNRLVLTAIHCFTRRNVNRTEVWLNERNLILSTDNEHPTLKIKAKRLIVHPEYNPIMNYNDIVLLELSESVDIQATYLRPICLPTDERYDAKEYAYTAGWGRISFMGPKSDQLRHVCLPLLSHDECVSKSVSYYRNRVTKWMICAGDIKNGGRDTCPGDSGGPLFVEAGPEPNRRHVMVGIVSWGEGCALPRRPGVYTKVSKYLPWIHKEWSSISDNTICG